VLNTFYHKANNKQRLKPETTNNIRTTNAEGKQGTSL